MLEDGGQGEWVEAVRETWRQERNQLTPPHLQRTVRLTIFMKKNRIYSIKKKIGEQYFSMPTFGTTRVSVQHPPAPPPHRTVDEPFPPQNS